MSMPTKEFMELYYPNMKVEWDYSTNDYILVDDSPIQRESYLQPGDIAPEEAFQNRLCMVNCFRCRNIDGLDEDKLYPMCNNASHLDHTHCFLCHNCYYKLHNVYYERNSTNISDNSKKRVYNTTPCGKNIYFED